MSPLIQCQHVDFGYDNQDAVTDVNMEVDPGDYLCIVGENGSGKSTLMKGLLGLIRPTGGTLVTADELKRTGIGYLPQQTAELMAAGAPPKGFSCHCLRGGLKRLLKSQGNASVLF